MPTHQHFATFRLFVNSVGLCRIFSLSQCTIRIEFSIFVPDFPQAIYGWKKMAWRMFTAPWQTRRNGAHERPNESSDGMVCILSRLRLELSFSRCVLGNAKRSLSFSSKSNWYLLIMMLETIKAGFWFFTSFSVNDGKTMWRIRTFLAINSLHIHCSLIFYFSRAL